MEKNWHFILVSHQNITFHTGNCSEKKVCDKLEFYEVVKCVRFNAIYIDVTFYKVSRYLQFPMKTELNGLTCIYTAKCLLTSFDMKQ